MNNVKEVLRLKILGDLSSRQIATLGLASKSAVSNIESRFRESGLQIEEALALSEEALEAKLFPERSKERKRQTTRPHPDWAMVHAELSKKGMTRPLLWQEYKERHPDGYGYTQFKEYYRRYKESLNPSMRQIHYAGDKLFVDFSGLAMPVVDPATGEVRKAQIFVSVLGASGHTFVHAVMSQSTEAFIECHNQAFAFYGGVPNQIVPDNLKAAVITHTRKKLLLNESYADMGRHYGVAIVPTRPYHPQDKGKVEAGVKGIQRWILMKLRHRTFFDVDELNDAISRLLDAYNDKGIRRIGKSRRELFEELDKVALHPLPSHPYRYREYKRARVGIDYHIELDGHGYSVPYSYLKKEVDLWYSIDQVSISYRGEVIAIHPRLFQPGQDSTLTEHMPPAHQFQREKWNPGRILNWAQRIGEETRALMEEIMQRRSHPVRGYRSCMEILNFSKHYGEEALERCCKEARRLGIYRVASIESMLKRKSYLEVPGQSEMNPSLFTQHENLRDATIYQ